MSLSQHNRKTDVQIESIKFTTGEQPNEILRRTYHTRPCPYLNAMTRCREQQSRYTRLFLQICTTQERWLYNHKNKENFSDGIIIMKVPSMTKDNMKVSMCNHDNVVEQLGRSINKTNHYITRGRGIDSNTQWHLSSICLMVHSVNTSEH